MKLLSVRTDIRKSVRKVTRSIMVSSGLVILVCLGYVLNPDGYPKPELISRVNVTCQVAQEYPNASIILTGGDPTRIGTSEAKVMSLQLASTCIEAKNQTTLLEEKSLDTVDNAVRVLEMIKKMCKQNKEPLLVVVITSKWHRERAMMAFQEVARASKVMTSASLYSFVSFKNAIPLTQILSLF